MTGDTFLRNWLSKKSTLQFKDNFTESKCIYLIYQSLGNLWSGTLFIWNKVREVSQFNYMDRLRMFVQFYIFMATIKIVENRTHTETYFVNCKLWYRIWSIWYIFCVFSHLPVSHGRVKIRRYCRTSPTKLVTPVSSFVARKFFSFFFII